MTLQIMATDSLAASLVFSDGSPSSSPLANMLVVLKGLWCRKLDVNTTDSGSSAHVRNFSQRLLAVTVFPYYRVVDGAAEMLRDAECHW